MEKKRTLSDSRPQCASQEGALACGQTESLHVENPSLLGRKAHDDNG